MYDVSVPDIYADMPDIIEYVTGLGIFHSIHRFTVMTLIVRSAGKAVSEMLIYRLCEARTVASVSKACAARHIGIPYELLCI